MNAALFKLSKDGIPMNKISKFVTWQNGVIAAAVFMGLLAAYNGTRVAAYSASPPDGSADISTVVTGWILSAMPAIASIVLGFIAKFLGVDPEYVAAVKDFAKNPAVVEIERRMINSAVQSILPRLGSYPEYITPILKAIADSYASDAEVKANVAALSQSVSRAIMEKPAT